MCVRVWLLSFYLLSWLERNERLRQQRGSSFCAGAAGQIWRWGREGEASSDSVINKSVNGVSGLMSVVTPWPGGWVATAPSYRRFHPLSSNHLPVSPSKLCASATHRTNPIGFSFFLHLSRFSFSFVELAARCFLHPRRISYENITSAYLASIYAFLFSNFAFQILRRWENDDFFWFLRDILVWQAWRLDIWSIKIQKREISLAY